MVRAYSIIFIFALLFFIQDSRLKLVWDANTEPDMLRYHVYRAVDDTLDNFELLSYVPHSFTDDTLFYIDSLNINFWHTYAYYLLAEDSTYLVSDPSDTVWIFLIDDDPLPITLQSLRAYYRDNSIDLIWTTMSELRNLGFNIYRDDNKLNDKLIPGAGNSSEENIYLYNDADITGGCTYRYELESVSINGVSEIESEVTITTPRAFEVFLSPNPANTMIDISLTESDKNGVVKIYNILGQSVLNKRFSGDNLTLNVKSLPAGNYFYILEGIHGHYRGRFIIVK